jgi:hypothetical protein
MPFLTGHSGLRRIVAPTIILSFALFGYSGTALAYGPPVPPPGPPGVGAFGCVLTSQQIAAGAAATLGPLADGELVVTLHVGAFTFRHPVEVTITEPYSPSGSCASDPASAGRGFQIAGGVGVVVGNANDLFWSFPRPVWLTINDPDLAEFQFGEVVPLDSGHASGGGVRTHGPVTLAVDNSSDWLYLVRNVRPYHGRGFDADAMYRARDSGRISAAVAVTAALLPDGRTPPGTGVVLTPGAGQTLTAGGPSTTAK